MAFRSSSVNPQVHENTLSRMPSTRRMSGSVIRYAIGSRARCDPPTRRISPSRSHHECQSSPTAAIGRAQDLLGADPYGAPQLGLAVADEHEPRSGAHPPDLRYRLGPRRDQMQHVPEHEAVEGPVAKRQPGGVAHHDRERGRSARLLHQPPKHRRGQIDAEHRDAGPAEPKAHLARPNADLEDALAGPKLGRQESGLVPVGALAVRPRSVVVLRRAIERDGSVGHGGRS